MARTSRPTYRNLDPRRIVETVERLAIRVEERFPGAGLAEVAADLADVGRLTARRARNLRAVFLGVRTLTALVILVWLAGEVMLLGLLGEELFGYRVQVLEIAQGVEAAVNLSLVAAAGVWFLITLEQRIKRARLQTWLGELRAFAHVVDMHQLTKDPTVIGGPPTSSSPERGLTRFELARYLDYCAEMLSLIGKLCAVYAESTTDSVAIAACADVENLTSDLARKIWQKITLLAELDDHRGPD